MGRADHAGRVVPLRISSIHGMKLLQNIHTEQRLTALPQIIYLDSARLEAEVQLELEQAWRTMAAPGILFGNGWSAKGVQNALVKLAASVQFSLFTPEELQHLGAPLLSGLTQPVEGIAVSATEREGTWFVL